VQKRRFNLGTGAEKGDNRGGREISVEEFGNFNISLSIRRGIPETVLSRSSRKKDGTCPTW